MTMVVVQPWELGGTMIVDGTFFIADGIVDTNATSNYGLTSTGTFQVVGGNFTANASTVTMGNDVIIANTAGLFTAGTSNVDLIGSSELDNANTPNAFYNLHLAAASQTTTLINTTATTNQLFIGSGTLTADASHSLNVGSAASPGTKLITFDANGALDDSGGDDIGTIFLYSASAGNGLY